MLLWNCSSAVVYVVLFWPGCSVAAAAVVMVALFVRFFGSCITFAAVIAVLQ